MLFALEQKCSLLYQKLPLDCFGVFLDLQILCFLISNKILCFPEKSETEQPTEKCSVKKETGNECYKTSYKKVVKLNLIETLSVPEKELSSLRSWINFTSLLNVCEQHRTYYMKSTYQTTRFDTFKISEEIHFGLQTLTS